MNLSATEQQLCQCIEHRADAMLDQLTEHVAIPTGARSASGLDRYRGLLVERLAALRAEVGEIPGDPRPTWLDLSSERVAELAGMSRDNALIGAIGTRFEAGEGIVPGNINR